MGSRFWRLISTHFRKIHTFHQAVHSAAADVNAIFLREAFRHFLCAQPFVTFDVKCKDLGSDASVFNSSAGILSVTEFVVGASIYIQNPAKRCNRMLVAQRMDCV